MNIFYAVLPVRVPHNPAQLYQVEQHFQYCMVICKELAI